MKIFRDSVHGYIRIQKEWCRLFIDDPIFQRLRFIEQTSMRCLYPSAHHDRFIHSLGTFYLGGKAFAAVCENAEEVISGKLLILKDEFQYFEACFRIACLLHDCGHAPFSHTCEKYYGEAQDLIQTVVDKFKELKCSAGTGADCSKDVDIFKNELEMAGSKEHEMVSAFIVLHHYRDRLKEIACINEKYGDAAELIVRMIMGCMHKDNLTGRNQFENCLISMLNGKAFDVDKLDYICRDTWASGVDNVSIDVERLLGAITIVVPRDGKKAHIAFRKNALSVVQNMVEGKFFLNRWIHNHHKVCYEQYLIQVSIEEVLKQLDGSAVEQQASIKKLFSCESLYDEKNFKIGDVNVSHPADGDILYLIKTHRKGLPSVQEWMSRQHKKRAVWKTFTELDHEYKKIIKGKEPFNSREHDRMWKRIAGSLIIKDWYTGSLQFSEWLKAKGYSIPCAECLVMKDSGSNTIKEPDLWIALSDNEYVSYSELFAWERPKSNGRLFYLYLPIECKVTATDVIGFLTEPILTSRD